MIYSFLITGRVFSLNSSFLTEQVSLESMDFLDKESFEAATNDLVVDTATGFGFTLFTEGSLNLKGFS